MSEATDKATAWYDAGHRGDVDLTQLMRLARLTPQERLGRHGQWRGLVKRRGAPRGAAGENEAFVAGFVEAMVSRLTRANVEFVVVGGVSAVLQGAAVVTVDLDICYRRTSDNIARLVGCLRELRPRPREFPADLPFVFDERTVNLGSNFTLDVDNEDLDLLGTMSGLGGYDQVIDGCVDMLIDSVRVKVLSLEQLITTKTAAGRAKDLAVLPLLQAALELQKHHGPG